MQTETSATRWLNKAKDDLIWTKANIREQIWYGACFTAQQAAEKALKAYLLHHDIRFPKIHDLTALLERCKEIDSTFEELREDVIPLTDYYIQVRYPDMSDFMEYSEESATNALDRSQRVVKFISNKLEE